VSLEELEDRQAIYDVLVRYTHAIDHDLGLWDQVFSPDATLDYTTGGGDIATGSSSEMKQFMVDIHQTALATHHGITNVMIELAGDTARARTAIRGYLARSGTRVHLAEITDFIGYYDDVFARTAVGWRIVERSTTVTWREYRTMAYGSDPWLPPPSTRS
jgi:hypothetical protein